VENLIVNQIDLNNHSVVQNLLGLLTNLTRDRKLYHDLVFKPQHYFETPNSRLPNSSGWYIILEGGMPLYVGAAEDLNKRLNTTNGSIDNFANKGRASDPVRNFIKKYNQLGIIANLRVFIIPENKLFALQLNKLDRGNIEKFISVFRGRFTFI